MQVPPFNPSSVLGGSEVVAIYIAQALAADNAVTVLHGFPAEPQEYRGPDFPAEILPAFPFDYQDFDDTGHVTPAFTPTAQRKIAEADVIVSIETSLNLPVSAARVVFLGGVNGPHTHDIVQHRCWDRLVVPSDFAARQVDPGWQPFDASYQSFELPSGHGTVYSPSVTSLGVMKPAFGSKTLAPGETIDGWIALEVPTDYALTTAKLDYRSDLTDVLPVAM